MTIVKCGMRVALSADQACPSCGKDTIVTGEAFVAQKSEGLTSENPYEPPTDSPPAESKHDRLARVALLEVAKAQRFLCMVILVALVFLILGNLLANSDPAFRPLIGFCQVVICIFQVVAAFRLGNAVHDSYVVGCLMALFAIIPCFGLISLLIVNGQATKLLQANGYKVGLMGAEISDLRERS